MTPPLTPPHSDREGDEPLLAKTIAEYAGEFRQACIGLGNLVADRYIAPVVRWMIQIIQLWDKLIYRE